ncbi:MAG TPA: hypothetical protein VN830_09545 [Verrucomicrobiae bacterium]|nr:hypothetical protein [Verrucomicrobiae bacterium]
MRRYEDIHRILAPVAIVLLASALLAETPKLKIKTAHGYPMEEQRKEQMERLAKEYDLKKYTITRDIVIEKGAINHSSPVLTLNLRFLDNDDLALSAYVHEQGHWLLMERYRLENRALFEDLQRTFPNLDYRTPEGDGELRSSYFHIAVCMLEWQAMEELVGAERAQKVIEWKQRDHYKGIYEILLTHRAQVESVLNRHGVKW